LHFNQECKAQGRLAREPASDAVNSVLDLEGSEAAHTNTLTHRNAGAQNVVCAAVSDADDKTVVFHITNNVYSSSLLPLAENMSIVYPSIHESTLDTLYARRGLAPDAFDYAHFDIQGAELLALSGARTIIPHLRAIYTEVSVKPLYAGCVLLPEMDAFLATEGFTRVAVSQGITTSKGWGDALYLRK
jgi:FkbM family methyltransferase